MKDWDDETGLNNVIEVDFTDDEWENLAAAAERAGMTLNGYLRRRCFDDEFRARQFRIPANGNDG